MATQLFPLDSPATTHLGTNNANLIGTSTGWAPNLLHTARGASASSSANTATVTGPTPGVEVVNASSLPLEWISAPVSADVTISGTITLNIWASENSMNANVAINAVIDVIRANALGTANSNTIVEIARSTRNVEVAITTRAVNNFTVTPTSTVVNRGDRLRLRIFGDDVSGANMASGFTFNIGYSGSGAGVDGDTYVTFTETFSFESAPAGTVLYLTNTQSGLSGAPTLVSDFTGADENPLSEGGNWAALSSAIFSALQRTSNTVTSASSVGASYWTPANFGPDLDAYVTISTANASNHGILARIQGEGGAGTADAYTFTTTSTGCQIGLMTDISVTTLIATTSVTFASGDKLGCRLEGSTLQLWRQASGSSDWNLVLTAVDATYASAGKIGLLCNNTTIRLDDFYAGTNSNLFTQQAWTSRGAGVVSYRAATGAGWTAPLLMNEWFTKRLEAFTLTGMAQANIRANNTAGTANATLRFEIASVDSDGSNATVWSTWCCAPTGTDNGELATTEAARTINLSGDDLAVTAGQRLRIRYFIDDMSSAAMNNFDATVLYYNGTSGGASGDSYVTLAQTVTEYSPAVAAGAVATPYSAIGWLG